MNKHKFTYKNTMQLFNIIYGNDDTKNQPIDFIFANNKFIFEAIYRDTVIHGRHGIFPFKLDTSRISPDKLEGKKVYMNGLHVTDGSICARLDINKIGDAEEKEIIVKIGTGPFDASMYEVCILTITPFRLTVQNQTNSYNVRAEYDKYTKTLYLTDKAAEA